MCLRHHKLGPREIVRRIRQFLTVVKTQNQSLGVSTSAEPLPWGLGMKLTYSLSSSRTEGRGFLAVMVERVTPSMCQSHAKDRAKHSAISC